VAAYGELTHQSIDAMEPRPTRTARQARPADFALWKARRRRAGGCRVGVALGAGRPGWHIECSAMSRRYLGAEFDIHGGGIDLRFPHHENELAQSTAAGDAFARYWVHNGLVTVGDQKMSKSLGNHLLAPTCSPTATRSSCATRSAPRTTARRSISPRRPSTRPRRPSSASERSSSAPRACSARRAAGGRRYPEAFAAAMDDDLGVPQALAVVHETVRAGNAALDAAIGMPRRALVEVGRMTGVLGMNPADPQWRPEATVPRRAPWTRCASDDHPARAGAREQGLGGRRPHPRCDRGGRHRPRGRSRRDPLESE
jgi:cysteinyl-tRNA synthetase